MKGLLSKQVSAQAHTAWHWRLWSLLIVLSMGCSTLGPVFYLSTGIDAVAKGENGQCPNQVHSRRFTTDDTVCVFFWAETNQRVELEIQIRRNVIFYQDSQSHVVAEKALVVTEGSHLVAFDPSELDWLTSGTHYLVEIYYKGEIVSQRPIDVWTP